MDSFSQGFSSSIFLFLGLAKWAHPVALYETDWGRVALFVGSLEITMGIIGLRFPSKKAFGSMVAFSMILVIASVIGPPLPECYCLGAFSGLTAMGRTTLSLVLLALSLEAFRACHPKTRNRDSAL